MAGPRHHPGAEKYPRFGLGCWRFGMAGSDEEERDAIRVISEAYERGVRHFDTARGYGDGLSERLVSAALAGRDDAKIATKSRALGYEETLLAVDDSLRRLGREQIDLFYVHWPRTGFDIRPMIEALESARVARKIGAIGVSNFSVSDLDQAREAGRVEFHQVGYSLLWRFAEREITGYCRANSIRVISYSSLAQGLLSGRTGGISDLPGGDPRRDTVFYEDEVWPHVQEAVTRMVERAGRDRIQLNHAALRWLTDSAGVDRVLVGARSTEQLGDTLAAFDARCDAPLLADLQAISDTLHPYLPQAGNIFRYYPTV